MRFHIGFSKRISFKKLIEIIGFLFVACLTFFGIYDTTHAWTRINYGSFTGREIQFYNYSNNKLDTSACGGNITTRTNFMQNLGSYCLWYDQYDTNKYRLGASGNQYINGTHQYYKMFNIATSKGYLDTYNVDEVYTDSYSFDFSSGSSSYCSNNTEDPKSINFKFRFDYTPYFSNYDFFNLDSDITKLLALTITAYDDTGESIIPYNTTCTYEPISSTSIFQVYCNNVYSGTLSKPITKYSINFINISPFNDRYSNSLEEKAVVYSIDLTYSSNSSSNYDYTLQYECSDEPPVFDPICSGIECIDRDPGGLNDIYDLIKDNYSTSLPGINVNNFVDIPSNFTDLLMLPLDVLNAIINNSTGTCETYSIDMSSIVSRWGNENSHYYLELPCMRAVLSNKLGGIYTLCDLLFCFILFYNIAMHIVRLINAITYGEDLFTIFYTPTERSEMLVGTSDGSYTRSRGWFE